MHASAVSLTNTFPLHACPTTLLSLRSALSGSTGCFGKQHMACRLRKLPTWWHLHRGLSCTRLPSPATNGTMCQPGSGMADKRRVCSGKMQQQHPAHCH